MNSKTRNIAVITGDLVNSTELGREKVERAFAALEDCAKTQAEWHGAPLHFTRHRGDGWQVVLARPEMALRSALAFRAALRAEGSEFDSYMGIAEGEVEGDVGPDLNAETGPVFLSSGNLLEFLKSQGGNVVWAHSSNDLLDGIFHLAEHISKDWTPVQATTVLAFLSPLFDASYTEVAKTLGKSRQAISKAVFASGYIALDYAMDCAEGQKA